jgi:hypothetical protein
MKKFWQYLLSGVGFLLAMEFMFQVQIEGDFIGFLLTPILQIPFLLFTYFSSKIIDKELENTRFKELFIYIVYGLIGLFLIEWLLIGNTPWGNPDAVQFIMFSYWGGAVVFSRILTEENKSIRGLRKIMLGFFIISSLFIIILGFFIPFEDRLGPIVLMALFEYGLMNIFYIWYFINEFRSFSTVENHNALKEE